MVPFKKAALRAPARAQDLVLAYRVKDYRAGELERLYPRLPIEEAFFFNYGFLPRETLALLHPRGVPRAWDAWDAKMQARAQEVLAFVHQRGLTCPKDVQANFDHGHIKRWGGGFRLSGGVRIDGNRADVTSTPTSNIQVGSNTYTPAQLGTLSGDVKYNRVAPYVGLGYGGRVASWLELGFDAGVLYQGKPKVSLGATGAFANNPMLQADLDQQRAAIQSKINWTEWYPVLMLEALFRF